MAVSQICKYRERCTILKLLLAEIIVCKMLLHVYETNKNTCVHFTAVYSSLMLQNILAILYLM